MLFSSTGTMGFVPGAPEEDELPPSFPSVYPPSCAPHQEFQGSISLPLLSLCISFMSNQRRIQNLESLNYALYICVILYIYIGKAKCREFCQFHCAEVASEFILSAFQSSFFLAMNTSYF